MLVLSILCNLISFGIYQVMVPLFIFGSLSCFYLYIFEREDAKETKKLWILASYYVGVFIVSFFINQLITKIFFSHGDAYLNDQIAWGTMPVKECLLIIYSHFREVAFGTQIYYVKTFSVFALILVGMTIFFVIKHPKRGGNVLGILALLLIFLAPFYMTLLCGQTPVIRSQLVMPFVVAFFAYACFAWKKDSKIYAGVILLVCALTLFLQVKYTTMLNHSDQARYDRDVEVATDLMARIDQLQNVDRTVPVVFLGAYPMIEGNGQIKGDVIGYSFFEWDASTAPVGVHSTKRILCFMNYLGKHYEQADEQQTIAAISKLSSLACYPDSNCIQKIDDVIIVKLGELTGGN